MTPQSLSRAFAELRSVGVSGRQVAITGAARLREFTGGRALK